MLKTSPVILGAHQCYSERSEESSYVGSHQALIPAHILASIELPSLGEAGLFSYANDYL